MKVEQEEKEGLSFCCSLLGYSRQAYYQKIKDEQNKALKEEIIIEQVLEQRKIHPRIGGRKLLVLIDCFIAPHGISMGKDAFFDLLRQHRLLIKSRRRKPRTTWSDHWMHKYPNLIKGFIPIMPCQLWVSDITFVNIENKWAFLSMITDVYSHKIVGYYLSKDLTVSGPLRALKMAIENNPLHPYLIHHSDRGAQYCCADYVALLTKHQIKISMTQSGNPRENAIAERANGIIKGEYLDKTICNFNQAQNDVIIAINKYNNLRPHDSIDKLTPAEAHQRTGYLKKHWKNYYPKKQKEDETYA
jgi:putative transposase